MKAPVHLFVYGTLRRGFDGPMAAWLGSAARWIGPGRIAGRLYRIADYPGFVPGGEGHVVGDLFALFESDLSESGLFDIDQSESGHLLARLDAYEECSADFPTPHEYRREPLLVDGAAGPVLAWIYVYARDVAGLDVIDNGDFLIGSPP